MCMEDIRLGRQLAAQARAVPINQTTTFDVCGVDPMRTRLVVSADGQQAAWLIPPTVTPAASTGIALTVQNPVVVIDVERYGKLVQGNWKVSTNALGMNLVVIETTLDKQ